jgi:muramoyltetrapeptide carboxypeptidase
MEQPQRRAAALGKSQMSDTAFVIGVVAPAGPVDPAIVEPIQRIANDLYEDRVAVRFHPHCFLTHGHFAGDDKTRAAAMIEFANAPDIDAIWFGRGGYGSVRVARAVFEALDPAALEKRYLGYSDIGVLLAGLYNRGAPHVAHGPMAHDLYRENGRTAVTRALHWLVDGAPDSLEAGLVPGHKAAAFNLTVLCHLIGTSLEPEIAGHDLLLEEVSEQMYRIDRCFSQLADSALARSISGLRLGRCSQIIANEPEFALTEEEIARKWCARAGIPYLGRADIGHDADNKIVPFGS